MKEYISKLRLKGFQLTEENIENISGILPPNYTYRYLKDLSNIIFILYNDKGYQIPSVSVKINDYVYTSSEDERFILRSESPDKFENNFEELIN